LKKAAKSAFLFLFLVLLCCGPVFSQTRDRESRSSLQPFASKLQTGINLYRESRWHDAVRVLREAQEEAPNAQQKAEALYWIALSELSAAEYDAALKDMDELERNAPGGARSGDIAYHRGRAYYYLGYYEEAIILLSDYAGRAGEGQEARKSAAYYWIGECLFSLGQLDKAQDFFTIITEQFPDSAKFEAASYRLELIKQKRVERELLTLLQQSHEESLRTVEEYQRREKSYDQALNQYQRRIADNQKDTRLSEMESANEEYRRRLAEADERIYELERRLGIQAPPSYSANPPEDMADAMRARALELKIEMEQRLNELTGAEGGIPE
jgi:tetratricopeptide (TPR) repeat protein